jgi:predicted 3-demethylubiquinone-9 3-methyltransferase (glyoxalase superfamily)
MLIADSLPRSKDKYRFSRQIVQTTLEELMSDSDKEKPTRVMKDLLQMGKLDIQDLKNAAAA